MRAAIIGANSYIARNFIRVNESAHYADTALYDVQPEHLDGAAGYRQINVSNQTELEQAIEGNDLIYFFVGKTGTLRGFDDPGTFVDVNEKFLLNLLNAYRSVGSKAKIVFPSTRLVYRGSGEALSEDAEKEFLTPYAIQKYACEQYLEMYSRMFGVKYCILRICVPYGTLVQPVSSYGTLDFFMNQAVRQGVVSVYGDGEQRRTFTYIGDLCHALWQAGLNDRCVNDVYNVGGEDFSIGQIAQLVAGKTAARVLHRDWQEDALKIESGSTVFNSEKLDSRLDIRRPMTVTRWADERLSEERDMMTSNWNKKETGGGYVVFVPALLRLMLSESVTGSRQ